MNAYIPVVMMLILGLAFVLVTIGLNTLFNPKRANRAKYDTYECGIDPTPEAQGGGRFPVKFYVLAMLYIAFDTEIVFHYAWAVSFNKHGLLAVVEMILFMITVFVAYFYVYRRRGLDWE